MPWALFEVALIFLTLYYVEEFWAEFKCHDYGESE